MNEKGQILLNRWKGGKTMKPESKHIVMITGSTDGLGRKVAMDMVKEGATILLHGRNPQKGEAVIEEIRTATGNRSIRYYNAELSSLDSVRSLAARIKQNHNRLDILVNNAGIGARSRGARRELSADGYELRFAVNYLSHYLLTWLLLPLLKRSAPARIINISSVGQNPIDFSDVMLERGYDDLRAYRQSKLALIMFTFDLAEVLKGSGVTVNCLHPASLMNTKMVLQSSYFGSPLSTVGKGAEAVEYLALSPEVEKTSGVYFNGKQPSQAEAQAYDPASRAKLRELSQKLAGVEIRRHRIAKRVA
jgi:NAD(P)-dependent dehydrogenase (short-subunit alcohol dehydrogenase family)